MRMRNCLNLLVVVVNLGTVLLLCHHAVPRRMLAIVDRTTSLPVTAHYDSSLHFVPLDVLLIYVEIPHEYSVALPQLIGLRPTTSGPICLHFSLLSRYHLIRYLPYLICSSSHNSRLVSFARHLHHFQVHRHALSLARAHKENTRFTLQPSGLSTRNRLRSHWLNKYRFHPPKKGKD